MFTAQILIMKKNKHAGTCYKFRIGANIRKWRNLKDIKQKDLALALQLSDAAVSNIENDVTNLTVTQLEDISIALNVSIEQLLSDPQESYKSNTAYNQSASQQDQKAADKELVSAMILSLEKKDEQLQTIMQHFLHAMTEFMHHEKPIFKHNKQLASSA